MLNVCYQYEISYKRSDNKIEVVYIGIWSVNFFCYTAAFDISMCICTSQVSNWFLANNRTANHVLTLRTLIDKYVHCHKEKIYACFVDFRKAFDSVWHDGLLYKLSKINVQGKFYSVIKSLYSKSTCFVRIGNNKMRSFQYAR